MAIINVEDAYILNETGAQVDKTTGIPFKNESLTDAEAAQARANIRAGGSNRNLLDNAYFVGGGSQLGDGVFPINQRGLSNYGAGYTIDRWKLSSGGTLVFTNDGISIDGLFFQKKVIDFTVGETYTLSRQTTDGNVVSVTGVVPSTEGWMIGNQTFGVYFRPSTKVCDIQIWGTYLLKAVKLEKGSVSTLANDAPPDYATELLKCMRYFQRLKVSATMSVGFGTMTSGTEARVTIPLPVPLRSAPTVSVGEIGSFRIVSETQAKTPSSFTYLAYSPVGVAIQFVVPSGIAELNNVSVQINSTTAYIDLSADL